MEAAPSEEPLPELGKSDAPFRKALGEALGSKWLTLVLSEELIHHIVVTVDNLPRKHLRIAYTTDEARLVEAAERIRRVL